jgi:hypothetical protein
VALASALVVAAPVLAGAAHADDPVATVTDSADEGVAVANDLLAGCTPVVSEWQSDAFTMTPYMRGASTWYKEISGATAVVNCSTAYRVRSRIIDTSVPPFVPYAGGWSTDYYTGKRPHGDARNDVPYFGPDAPGVRPVGNITVHVELARKVGRRTYLPVANGCIEFNYVAEPSIGFIYGTIGGACEFDAAFALLDAKDSVTTGDE